MSEDTQATNELINDDAVQTLSTAEVEALKRSGMHASVGLSNVLLCCVNLRIRH